MHPIEGAIELDECQENSIHTIEFLTELTLLLEQTQWIVWKQKQPWSEKQLREFYEVEQNTPKWHEYRKNFIGASSLGGFIGTSTHTKPRCAITYALGAYNPLFIDPHRNDSNFEHGHKFEDVAAKIFELIYGIPLLTVGIIVNNKWPSLGASLDRIARDDPRVCVEIKCPIHRVHYEIPSEYMTQVQMQMHLSERDRCYFVSFLTPHGPKEPGRINVFMVEKSEDYWYKGVLPRLADVFVALETQNIHFKPKWENDPMPACKWKLDTSEEVSYDDFVDLCDKLCICI